MGHSATRALVGRPSGRTKATIHEKSQGEPGHRNLDEPDCHNKLVWTMDISGSGEKSIRSQVAGHDAIQYRRRSNDRDEVVAFAPALGCQLMLLREIQYGRLGLPFGISEFRVTSIRRAGREPDLFPPPSK